MRLLSDHRIISAPHHERTAVCHDTRFYLTSDVVVEPEKGM
jgi:hypothetical protein